MFRARGAVGVSLVGLAVLMAVIGLWPLQSGTTPQPMTAQPARGQPAPAPAVSESTRAPVASAASTASNPAPVSGTGAISTAAVAMPAVGRRFWTTADYAAFVARHLDAARDGDAAAQYYIGHALEECAGLLRVAGGLESRHFDALLGSLHDELTPEHIEWARSDFMRCAGFGEATLDALREEAFADRAVAAGYPPAVADQLVAAYFDASISDQAQRADRLVNDLVALGRGLEPEVLLALSQLPLAVGRTDAESSSAAFLLLACRQGLPCGARNPLVRASGIGSRHPATSMRALLERNLSPAQFREAEAAVGAIVLSVRNGENWTQTIRAM